MMNTNDLLQILDNDEINFIAECGSVLQMNGVNVSIYYLESKGIEINGVVLLKTSKTLSIEDYRNNYFVQRKKLKYIPVEGEIDFSNSFEKIDVFRKSFFSRSHQDVIYFIGANLIHSVIYAILMSGKKAVYVEIDDGTENYFNRHRQFMIMDFAGKNYPVYLLIYKYIKRVMNDISYSILYSIFKNKGNYIEALILHKSNKLIKNDRIVKIYHYVLRKNGRSLLYQDIKMLENCVLVVGTGVEGMKILKSLISKLLSANLVVVFKPHPRDKNIGRYHDLGCKLFQNESISLESIVERLIIKPRCIVGACCTTLVTGKILFDIKTINFSNLIKDDVYFEKYSKLFFDAFEDIVLFPNSMNELINMVCTV